MRRLLSLFLRANDRAVLRRPQGAAEPACQGDDETTKNE
jgi:hypothetical protein